MTQFNESSSPDFLPFCFFAFVVHAEGVRQRACGLDDIIIIFSAYFIDNCGKPEGRPAIKPTCEFLYQKSGFKRGRASEVKEGTWDQRGTRALREQKGFAGVKAIIFQGCNFLLQLEEKKNCIGQTNTKVACVHLTK